MEWNLWDDQLWMVGRIALAMLLGGLIGLERELANRPAGFRTHMLVAGMAAMMVGLTDPLLDLVHLRGNGHVLNSDPIRVIEAIVAGIAFLGAGTIFRREGSQVEGLTTAASLLSVGAIGVAVGARQYVLAVAITALILLVLRGILFVEKRAQQSQAASEQRREDGRTRGAKRGSEKH